MIFHTQVPVAIVGYFTTIKQSGNSYSSPVLRLPKRRVYYEAIAL